ncbi:MAG: hypothetical protein JWO56_3031 [Acidobacteria bacterium]|nr:hypothetical protein [Acidobacteriota bacterium]
MSARVRRPATYEELREVPDHLIAELIDEWRSTGSRTDGGRC